MKIYDSYKNSGVEWIGQIPSNWECIRLGMLGDFSSSGIDKKSNEDETPVRMVNYTDIIQSRKYYPIQTGEKEYMKVTTPQSKLEEHKLERGDMVFIPSSETHEDLGYSSLIDFDEEDIVYSYHILRYKTKKSVYHYYKKYLINHHSVLNQFSSECKGTTRQIIGRDVFNNVRVVLPPLSEQQQIVSFLDTKTSLIDSLIEKTQRKIELLKEKRTSLINEVVTKGLNPNVEMKDSGVEWIGEIPSGWERTKLKRYVSIFTGYSFKSDWFGEEGIPVIRISNIQDGFIDFTKSVYLTENYLTEYPDYVVKRDDTLICLTGSLTGKVGKFNHELGLLNQRVGKIVVRGNKVLKSFIDKVFFFQKFQGLIKEMGEGISENFPNVSHLDVVELEIPLPPISEQQQIVEYLDKQTQLIDKTISIEENRIELLKEYRQSLISEVVTGKRKVVE